MDKNKIIEAATKYVQKGQYDKAIKEYEKVLAAEPKDTRLLQKIGELYQKKGDNGQAAEFLLRVGDSYTSDGFFLKAVAVLKQVLKLDDGRIDVNLKLAELYQQLGLMSDAMAQMQIVGAHYEKTGNAQATLDLLRRMVELDPENVASRIKLAELYARDGHNQEAISEFDKAATFLKRNNRVDDYVKVAERLVFLDPSNMELARELAQIYLAKQDTKRALAKLQVCFKADPRDVETLTLLAQAFLDLGQTAKTISVYKELARIFDESDRIDDERRIWEKIRQVAPDDPDAARKLAPPVAANVPAQPVFVDVSRVAALQQQPAAQQQQQASAAAAPARSSGQTRVGPAPTPGPLTPDQIAKLLTETDVYVKYGLHDKAFDHLRKVFAADPSNLDAHDKAWQLAKATGNHAKVEEELIFVVRQALYLGDADRARARLQTLLEINPGHEAVAELLESLAQAAPSHEEVDDSVLLDSEEAEVVSDDSIQLDDAVVADDDHTFVGDVDSAVVEEEEADHTQIASADDGDHTQVQMLDLDDSDHTQVGALPPQDDDAIVSLADEESEVSVLSDEPIDLLSDELQDQGLSDAVVAVESATSEVAEESLVESAPDSAYGADVADDLMMPAGESQEGPDEGATRVVDLTSIATADDRATQASMQVAPREAYPTSVVPSMPDAKPPARAARLATQERPAAPAPMVEEPWADEPVESMADDSDLGTQAAIQVPSHLVGGATDFGEPSYEEVTSAPEPLAADPAGDELDEAQFFLSQGDVDEARDILETVMLAYPGNARAAELMAELEAASAGSPAAPAPEMPESTLGGDNAFDLAAELADELGSLGDEPTPGPVGEDNFQISHEDVFREFKKGVSKVVKAGDADTHYDLGIAYREMGLMMDAIGEFEMAMEGARGKPREIDCLSMIGACRKALGDVEGAVDAYKEALALPHIHPDGRKAMQFEIATAHEEMGSPGRALWWYLAVERSDGSFRDVQSIIDRLRAGGATPEADEVEEREEATMVAPMPPPKPSGAGGGANGAPSVAPKAAAPTGAPSSRKIGYL